MTKADATIRDAALLWLKRCQLDGLERATIRSYKGHFTHHIEPKIGDLMLKEFTASDVQDFIDDLLEEISRPMTEEGAHKLAVYSFDCPVTRDDRQECGARDQTPERQSQ